MFADWAEKVKEREMKYFSWRRMIIVALVLTFVIKFLVIEKFYIYSVSMLPTIHHRDWVWVKKYSYGYSAASFPFRTPIAPGVRIMVNLPERGDVAVFKSPRENERWPYIKRIIGLPGDRVKMSGGRLYINGELVPRQEIGGYEREDSKHNRLYIYRQYLETLPNGVKHRIIELSDDRVLDNVHEILIPAGYYLFMGDNRDESEDSRGALGLIPFENIIGKAQVNN